MRTTTSNRSAFHCDPYQAADSGGGSGAPAVSARFAIIGDYGAQNGDFAKEMGVPAFVNGWKPDFIVTLGDNAYPGGSEQDFAQCFATTWGDSATLIMKNIRPSVGMALFRIVTPFGAFAWERAIPLRPRLGDDPRGRWHISFAARAQF